MIYNALEVTYCKSSISKSQYMYLSTCIKPPSLIVPLPLGIKICNGSPAIPPSFSLYMYHVPQEF